LSDLLVRDLTINLEELFDFLFNLETVLFFFKLLLVLAIFFIFSIKIEKIELIKLIIKKNK